MKITFKHNDNYLAFQNMLENMWLNWRDDSQQPELGIADRLIDELNAGWNKAIDRTRGTQEAQYPMTLEVSSTGSEVAESVLENALEYSSDYDSNRDGDGEPLIREGEVSITV